MNYQRVYNAIVDNAKLRQTLDGYYELHHIIPRSLGGDDSQENTVKVTAREHFILHYLLCKIYKEQDQFNKMLYVVDFRQTDHFKALFTILKKLDFDFTDKLHHLKFGTVKFRRNMFLKKGKK